MATPLSAFSNVAENETGPRKTVTAAGGKPKFALQDRSNVVLKKTSSRVGTPMKAFGGGAFSLTTSSKGNRQENQHRAPMPHKLFDKNLRIEQEPVIAGGGPVDENGEEFLAPEKMHIPQESDFDYYSSIPSPSDKLRASQLIRDDCSKEGYGGPSDKILREAYDQNADEPSRCMSPVLIRRMAFGVYQNENENNPDHNTKF